VVINAEAKRKRRRVEEEMQSKKDRKRGWTER